MFASIFGRDVPQLSFSFFSLMDFTSYWNIWFWVVLVISWSISSHYILGVPFDMILQAERKGGAWADHCDRIIRANVFRITGLFAQAGTIITGLAAFVIAVIGSLGFYVGLEFARALFVLIVPHAIAGVFTIRLAFILDAQDLDQADLRRAIRRRRFWTQVIGACGLAIAASMPVIEYYNNIEPF